MEDLPRTSARVLIVSLVRLNRKFKKACRDAELGHVRIHDLRHSFPSQAVMAGMDLVTLQQIVGHRSLQMTMRYAHLAPGHAARAVNLVDLGADCVRDLRARYVAA